MQRAIAYLRARPGAELRVADLGTGSGCIAITLAAEVPGMRVIGDRRECGVHSTSRAPTRHHIGVDVDFVECSWAAALDGQFDLIVSNPPYVTTAELEGVDRDVRDFEPHGALLGGEDGLDAYRALLQSVRDHVTTARLMLEVDPRHADAVAALDRGDVSRSDDSAGAGPDRANPRPRRRDAVSLDAAVRAIRRGGVIVIPTDTVYGLACDPANTAAVSRIYTIKRRPAGLELTLLAASLADVEADVDLSPGSAHPGSRVLARRALDHQHAPQPQVGDPARRLDAQRPRAGASARARVAPAHRPARHHQRQPPRRTDR